jgi:hypothetical protein
MAYIGIDNGMAVCWHVHIVISKGGVSVPGGGNLGWLPRPTVVEFRCDSMLR